MYVEENTCIMCVGEKLLSQYEECVWENNAECAWEIDLSIFTECVWENDVACYFKNLLMLCYIFITYITIIIMTTLNENSFTYLPLRTIGICVS